MIEVPISRVQNEIVLKNQGSEPHVVGRNRRSLFSELKKNRGIVMRSLVIGEDDIDAFLKKKASQCSLVLRLTTTVGEACPQFAEDDKRHDDRLGLFEEHHCLDYTFAEIDISVGVECYLHSQRSSST